jgi:uncharacterized membrane protein
MEKIKYFRIGMATGLCVLLVVLVWSRAEWSTVQIGCWVVILLAGLALLVNNQRNEAFHDATYIPLIAAVLVFFWVSKPLHSIQIVINILLSSLFGWFALKPYFIKWKKSHSPTDGSIVSPVELDGKSNG